MIRAWRVWTIGADAGRYCLKSFLDPRRNEMPTNWQPGPNKAACKFHDHFAPDYSCRCGFRGQPLLGELVWWLSDFKHVTADVIGAVELSGAVLTGDPAHPEIPNILRAEYAEIISPVIMWQHAATEYGSDIECLYGVEVRAFPAKKNDQWYKDIPADWFEFKGGLL